MPNDELFVQVLAEIERNPAAWKQDWWAERTHACGTTFCFAGHAVVQSGLAVKWRTWLDGEADSSHLETGEHIQDAARRLLGLEYEESALLFDAPTNLDKVYRICAGILGLDPQVLRDKVQDRA